MSYRKQQQLPPRPTPLPLPSLPPQPEIFLPYGQVNLINVFVSLWGEIAIWMRSYIAAVAAGYANIDALSNRLYRIPVDFHDRLRLVFGRQPAEAFLNLISMHIILTETIINALRRGDEQAVNTNTVALYKNADEIASLLRQINPFWSEVQWRNLLYTFISMNLQEAIALMSGDYERDIDIYDRLISHTELIGEYMADGIIRYLVISQPIT